LKLKHAEGVGPVTFFRLVERFGSPEAALGASAQALCGVEGIGRGGAERIARTREEFDAERELAWADELGVDVIHMKDKRYPVALRKIYDPPPVLYVKGKLERRDALSVAMVGSRRCSLYGQETAGRLAHLLASAGITIVSGMARGIDTAAHQGALSAGGRTAAVLGCGLSRVYPPESGRLVKKIGEAGVCVSELPLGAEPLAEHFPPRNRIIAGMSLGTIVVEAGLRSGAMITAREALDNNREVMAVPGKVDSRSSRGAHKLIKEGARLVEGVEDVMDALGFVGEQVREPAAEAAGEASERVEGSLFSEVVSRLGEGERAILEVLGSEERHVEEVIAETGLDAGQVHSALVGLRLKGLVRQGAGQMYSRR
jgi:DNA processing protein